MDEVREITRGSIWDIVRVLWLFFSVYSVIVQELCLEQLLDIEGFIDE